MDLGSLKEQVTNLSLYDLKAGVRKVQNGKPTHAKASMTRLRTLKLTWAFLAVMNYTEMEAKVGGLLSVTVLN